MSRVALFTASALALVAGAFGHARLLTPVPWNQAPTTSGPCGGANKLAPSATWVAGSTVTMKWQLIAGDGAGPVIVTLNTLGAQDPAGSAGALPPKTTTTTTTASDLRTYDVLFQVPAGTVCPDSGCTVQVKSANWFSCATVDVISAGSPEARVNSACQTASDLSFCSMMNGHSVRVAQGASMSNLDSQAESTYNSNLANSNVFGTPTEASCKTSYKNYVCFDTFPLCDNSNGVCQDACSEMTSACTLKSQHANLYKCDTYASQSCTNAASVAPCCTPGQSFGIFILVVVLVALVGFIGAMVYWRKNDPAKYDRVKAKPGEWTTAIKSKFGY